MSISQMISLAMTKERLWRLFNDFLCLQMPRQFSIQVKQFNILVPLELYTYLPYNENYE